MFHKKLWFITIFVLLLSSLSINAFAQETQGDPFEIWPRDIDPPDGSVDIYFPEGKNIVIRTSFAACARPMSNNWTKFDRVTLSMDGNSMVSSAKESKSYWSDPYAVSNDGVPCVNGSDKLWVVDWTYDLGALDPGTYPVHFTENIRGLFTDGADYDGDGIPDLFSWHVNVDFNIVITNYGSISGQVINEETDDPIEGIFVFACIVDVYCDSTYTDSNGLYQISLPPGTYRVGTHHETDYINEFYDDKLYWDEADNVIVYAGEETPNIEFALLPAGSISGTVIDEDTNLPIVGVDVVACYFDNSDICWWDGTAEDGSYQITGVPEGEFRVNVWSQQGYVEEFYNNVPFSDLATAVPVVPLTNTPDINFTLEMGGSISGTIIEEGTGLPIEGMTISACNYAGGWDGPCFHGWTEANGSYFIPSVPVGTYRVASGGWDTNWIEEYYADTIDWELADPVEVSADTNTPNINFTLEMGGTISGRVISEYGDPLPGLWVDACEYDTESFCASAETDGDGYYAILLPPDEYWVQVWVEQDWIGQRYDADQDGEPDQVPVLVGEDTGGIDFTLERGGSISGMVTDVDGNPLANMAVDIMEGGYGACTDENGYYAIMDLRFGTYDIVAGRDFCGPHQYVEEVMWSVEINEATPDVRGIDFTLELGGSISGNVSDANGPAAYVWVDACTWDASFCRGAQTNENGNYAFYGLPGGDYRVHVWGGQGGWLDQFFNGELYWDGADPVTVYPGADTGGIDFFMNPAGSISGVVTDESGNLISDSIDISACLYTDDSVCWWTSMQPDGSYTIGGPPTGVYRVHAYPIDGGYWFDEFYDNTRDWSLATEVEVTTGVDTSGIDFSLTLGGSISGNVTDASGNPVAHIWVDACEESVAEDQWGAEGFCGGTETNENGFYFLHLEQPGNYRVSIRWNNIYLNEFYNGAFSYDDATLVPLTPGLDTPNIHFALTLGGSISGIVTDEFGNLIPDSIDISACLYADDSICWWTSKQPDGSYTIGGLPTGVYRVHAYQWPPGSWLDEFYDNTRDWSLATPVAVTVGVDTPDINFTLEEAVP